MLNFCCKIETILIGIFLPKSKPILVRKLHLPPNKPEFIEYFDNSLKESNISNIQECDVFRNFNVNLLRGNKMMLKNQYSDSYSYALPFVKKYMDLCFSQSLSQSIMESTRTIKICGLFFHKFSGKSY